MQQKVQRYEYGGKVYMVPTLSAEGGIRFTSNSMDDNELHSTVPHCCCPCGSCTSAREFADTKPSDVCECSRLVHSVNTKWDFTQLGREPRKPLAPLLPHPSRWAKQSWQQSFTWDDRGATSVLDMPVKFPGSSEYRVPSECVRFLPVIEFVAALERTLNPNGEKAAYAYLTVDMQVVQPGQTQRHPGLHVDGFQGARIDPKVEVGRSYIVSDRFPTRFHQHTFPGLSELDVSKDDVFAFMEKHCAAIQCKEREDLTWAPKPMQMALFDAYCVHEAAVNNTPYPQRRTFMRISYSVREFDRLGNTKNPMFDYDWTMVPRDLHATLKRPAMPPAIEPPPSRL